MSETCPCGSEAAFSDCCDKFLSGRAKAPTAELLMRARYSAFVKGNIDFIERTHDPKTREGFDRAAATKWSKESKWLGLRILATKDGLEKDDHGVVRFIAGFEQGEHEYRHDEIASFRKEKGEWLFVDGLSPKPETFTKSGPDVGRNDPCHCGSGKKFKKCHGR
jgi:SEC-C motif-containing protein